MLCLSLIAPAAYAQNKNRLNMKKTEISKPPYVLGRYMIDPDNKQIGVYEMFGGVTWDGFRYRPSEKYNYKTTTLCFLGNKVFVTEDLDGVDINLLQLLYDGEKYIVFGDNKAIYKRYSHNNYNEKIDLTDYTHVTGFLYKDGNNNLFTIPYMTSTFRLEEVQGLPDLDLETIQHVACNYYTDKNGLYYLGYHDEYSISNSKLIKESVKLEDSGGKLITPVIHKRYFIYAKSVYAVNELSDYTKLELNPSRIKELPLHPYYGRYVITDCNNPYYTIIRQSFVYP